MTPVISLIVCTLGQRRNTLERLLQSLVDQDGADFEVIVVDQSGEKEVSQMVDAFSGKLRIRRVASERGLSRARNVGLAAAAGVIVGFPDDDCWYGPGVLVYVARFFGSRANAVLTGRTVDSAGMESVSRHREAAGFVDRNTVFESGNSNTVFARAAVARDVGGFDETLGVGAHSPFQSGEETDFLLRCLEKHYQVYFDHGFVVHHDQIVPDAKAQSGRVRLYAQGYGRLLRLHSYGVGYLGMRIGRAAGRGAQCLLRGDRAGARQRYEWISGVLRGFLSRPPSQPPRPNRLPLLGTSQERATNAPELVP